MEEEIGSIADLQRLVVAGETDWDRYGAVRSERFGDLILFDYRASAQWDNRWNWFERVSRGLILNAVNGEVVARPFDKFFNWGETGEIADTAIVDITEKLDGSLGIVYRHDGEYRVATRGAFQSTQAQWATTFLTENFTLSGLPDNLTLLMEIIYPDNRVVIDYHGREDLVLVGVRDRFTGEDYFRTQVANIASQFGFNLPEAFNFERIEDMLNAATSLEVNREGWVLRLADGNRFKVKGDAYKLVHRIVTQATFKQVLDATANGTLMGLIEGIPDEFLVQVRTWQADIESVVVKTHARVKSLYDDAPKDDRKNFALWAREKHLADSSYLFAMLDGRDITPLVYKMAFKERSEDESSAAFRPDLT